MRLRGFVQLNVSWESLERRGAKNFPLEVADRQKDAFISIFSWEGAYKSFLYSRKCFSMNMIQILRLLLHPHKAFICAKYPEHHVERREIGNSKW